MYVYTFELSYRFVSSVYRKISVRHNGLREAVTEL